MLMFGQGLSGFRFFKVKGVQFGHSGSLQNGVELMNLQKLPDGLGFRISTQLALANP